jgi:signal-transduction protein with cAMP-binding, CBS, and nucleotidyltransferase domain
LTSSQKDKVASIAINLKFAKGQTICKIDELASSMYIVKYGFLEKRTKTGSSQLYQGNYFGEHAML